MANENKVKAGVSRPVMITGVVLFIILAVAAYAYFDYQASADKLPMASAASQVSISQPGNGAEFTAFEPLGVNTMAIGPTPFLYVELWVNGELASVQTGPADGKTPLSATFAWLPQEEGDYSLIARAQNAEGQTVTSQTVLVHVGANEDLAEGSTAQFADVPAVAPPLGGGGYAPPSGPSGPAAPADDWQSDPGGWIDNLTNDQPPAAPELVINHTDGSCEADLQIHDLSDNEQGFAVFRQVGGGQWHQIKTLAAQSQSDWIEVADASLVGGQNTFYVSAFNSEGEAQSNLASVNVNPADCNAQLIDNAVQAVLLENIALIDTSAPDKLYCYRTLNGGGWLRWPASDFFYPDPDGLFVLNEVLQVVVADLEENSAITEYSLHLECWGWYGDDLEHLGALDHSNSNLEIGTAPVLGQGLSANVVYEALDGEGQGPLYELEGNLSADYVGDALDGVLKYIYPPNMVAPAAYVTYDPEECTSHLMPDAQNLLGTILFCFPYPGFHGSSAEGDNPQPYLVWNFFKYCSDGYGYEAEGGPCMSYAQWLAEAAATGGNVGFYVHDYSNAGYDQWVVAADNLRMFNIPPNGCEGQRTFQVQMFYEHADGFVQYSPNSNAYTIDCPKPVGNVLSLEFTFETLVLNGVDDDDGGVEDVEVYGYFQVIAPSSYPGNNNYLKMATWDKQNGDCSDDTGTGDNHRPSCPRILTDGSHNLYNIPLCPTTDYSGQDDWQCSFYYAPNAAQVNDYASNQNSLRVDVQDGDAITLWVILWDWDDASGNDLVCWGYAEYDSKTIFEWDAMDGQSFGFSAWGDVSTGSTCGVEGVISVHD